MRQAQMFESGWAIQMLNIFMKMDHMRQIWLKHFLIPMECHRCSATYIFQFSLYRYFKDEIIFQCLIEALKQNESGGIVEEIIPLFDWLIKRLIKSKNLTGHLYRVLEFSFLICESIPCKCSGSTKRMSHSSNLRLKVLLNQDVSTTIFKCRFTKFWIWFWQSKVGNKFENWLKQYFKLKKLIKFWSLLINNSNIVIQEHLTRFQLNPKYFNF